MYFIGTLGNQFYPKSFRFFSSEKGLLYYIDGERLAGSKQYAGTPHEEYIKELTKSLSHYILHSSYRCYKFELDKNEECENITKKQLAKMAEEMNYDD